MKAARLHGPLDMRVEEISEPESPQKGEVLLKIKAVGICGSDLHMYQDGRIGDTIFATPLVIGHEFMGEVIALGEAPIGGDHQSLQIGQRVAVDPSCPCYQCEMCETGHPNLCPNHSFYGVYPTNGAMQSCMVVQARNCFPLPDNLSNAAGTLLETLGVAIHTLDLAKLKVANSVAVIGCGPVGMLILKLAQIYGAMPVYAFDKLAWRVEKAREWGAIAYNVNEVDPVATIMKETNGRGVDLVVEAAWANESVQVAADIARIGGKIVLVGIPGDDRLTMQHSTPRRKGLTMLAVRRMKHTYPRAIKLATSGLLNLDDLVSHNFSLDETPMAFAKNNNYEEGVNKIILNL
jgi:L-iditol 2-dehydrogenase